MVVAALGVGVLASAVVALRPGSITARVGENVVVNTMQATGTSNSPTLLRNPVRPAELVVVNRVDRPPYSAQLHRSIDHGRTWTTVELPLPEGRIQPFAPDAAFAPDGTLHVAYVDLVRGANSPRSLWVTRSRDSGATLDPPVEVAGPYPFQARLAVDAGGVIYLTWLRAPEVAVRALTSDNVNPVVLARSDDGGRSFTEPVVVSDPSRVRVGAASPLAMPDGTVLVFYQDFKDDRRDFENLDGPVWESPFALVLTRSDDGGRTFGPGLELESGMVPSRRFLVFLPEFPAIAADAGGRVYVAWSDGRNGDDDVFVRRSGDGGRTWSEAVRVNDNPLGDGSAQRLPRVSASGDRVDIAFLDGRRDPGRVLSDVFVASSLDRGRTFRNLRVTSAPFDTRIGTKVAQSGEADFGTRVGLAGHRSGLAVAWPDSRLGHADDQRQDVVVAVLSIEAESRQPARWGVTAFAVVLVVMAAWRSVPAILRRRLAAEPDKSLVG